MRKTLILVIFMIKMVVLPAQIKLEPMHWWVGMKNPNLQILVNSSKISDAKISLKKYAGVKLINVTKAENPDFAFINLVISPSAKPGNLAFEIKLGKQTEKLTYVLKQKSFSPSHVSAADLIYLIMPDRFVNGNIANDAFKDMKDPNVNDKAPYLRHGGDFDGIVSKLDYLQDLGITTLWLNPVIENDERLMDEGGGRMQAGYHGYHFTDHYAIDKRFGGNEGYKKLNAELHKRGMKVIQDAVYNHVSDDHWLYKNPPAKDWFNQWRALTITSHKEQPAFDIHGTELDKKRLFDGWFTSFLPDVNQRNPECANYLIQHAIWTVEEFGIDAWRIDTYKYNDLAFMNRCNAALETEYPGMLIFGETWVNNVPTQASFTANHMNLPFAVNLPSGCDFVAFDAINKGLNEKYGWGDGVNRIYTVLSQDYLYKNPEKMVTFLDNHDTDRFYSVIGEDLGKYKQGIAWLLTSRGIPQIYYGTEILMKNFKNPDDAAVRQNFPGGFKSDTVNKFEAKNRTKSENEAFDYFKTLAKFRKTSDAIKSGKLTHFQPIDGVYTYFRHTETDMVMCIWNSSDVAKTIDPASYAEVLGTPKAIINIESNLSIDPSKAFEVKKHAVSIFKVLK